MKRRKIAANKLSFSIQNKLVLARFQSFRLASLSTDSQRHLGFHVALSLSSDQLCAQRTIALNCLKHWNGHRT